jgi:hypothetical protein
MKDLILISRDLVVASAQHRSMVDRSCVFFETPERELKIESLGFPLCFTPTDCPRLPTKKLIATQPFRTPYYGIHYVNWLSGE